VRSDHARNALIHGQLRGVSPGDAMSLVGLALAFAVVLVVAEASASAALGLGRYDLRDTLVNLAMGAGGLLSGALGRAAALPISYALWSTRAFELPRTWWIFALLVVAHDLCYYAFHRASHRVRLFWAAHVPHHSSSHYNLSTALRLSWTTPWTGIPFWWPLPLLGFDPLWIAGAHSISLAYQFLLHTEFVARLGPVEWVFNTPSHHRVHHGRDEAYLDKNFGGILIVWDRLFGTFAAERVRPSYGLVHPLVSHRPWVVAFHEWRAMLVDTIRSGSTWRRRLAVVLGAPGDA
jgi:sterol desaturase/sphingolipid hydroxylase (fatty acid hydroxylase superfamily)